MHICVCVCAYVFVYICVCDMCMCVFVCVRVCVSVTLTELALSHFCSIGWTVRSRAGFYVGVEITNSSVHGCIASPSPTKPSSQLLGFVCMCVCMYTHTYLYMYIYTYFYAHVCFPSCMFVYHACAWFLWSRRRVLDALELEPPCSS